MTQLYFTRNADTLACVKQERMKGNRKKMWVCLAFLIMAKPIFHRIIFNKKIKYKYNYRALSQVRKTWRIQSSIFSSSSMSSGSRRLMVVSERRRGDQFPGGVFFLRLERWMQKFRIPKSLVSSRTVFALASLFLPHYLTADRKLPGSLANAQPGQPSTRVKYTCTVIRIRS